MDLDELERLALAATPGPWHADKYGIAGDEDFTTPVVSWDYAWCECADEEANKPYIAAASPDVLLAIIARVRAAEAERDRLRDERDEAYPRALQAAADVVYQALTCDMPVGIAAAILALSADEIDAFAEQQEQAHRAESGEQ